LLLTQWRATINTWSPRRDRRVISNFVRNFSRATDLYRFLTDTCTTYSIDIYYARCNHFVASEPRKIKSRPARKLDHYFTSDSPPHPPWNDGRAPVKFTFQQNNSGNSFGFITGQKPGALLGADARVHLLLKRIVVWPWHVYIPIYLRRWRWWGRRVEEENKSWITRRKKVNVFRTVT